AITKSGVTEAASQPRIEPSITGERGFHTGLEDRTQLKLLTQSPVRSDPARGTMVNGPPTGRASRLPARSTTVPPWLSLALVKSSSTDDSQTAFPSLAPAISSTRATPSAVSA